MEGCCHTDVCVCVPCVCVRVWTNVTVCTHALTSLSHRHLPIDELSVGQFSVIRKLCLLRLTAMLEMYNPNNKIGPSL